MNLLMLVLFFMVIILSLLSSIVLLSSRISVNYVRVHIGVVSLPPILALFALVFQQDDLIWGPWRFNSLSWLLALFVLTMGLIMQRYSVHYLLGERSYRKYFSLLTLTTVAGSLAWISEDLRLLLICWGMTLIGLTWMIRLKKEWSVARRAASFMGRLFTMSWLFLLFATLWLAVATGQWQLSHIMSPHSLAGLESWEKTSINLLLIISVVIPSAQWPFQRWLLDSVVAPTPVSAVMHAGIVNAGGIILTLFAPLFNGDITQFVLLILSGISVLMGTGIMLVHVDYKRQLVGSTIAQMGFMLIQCALGAYAAAIIHAILHGLFKSTLFLQAGSALRQSDHNRRPNQTLSFTEACSGLVIGIFAAVGYWFTSTDVGYRFISATILGSSVMYAWKQLVLFGYGRIGRLAGFAVFIAGALMYGLVHSSFHGLLHETVAINNQPSIPAIIFVLFILLTGNMVGLWLYRNQTSKAFSVMYLWLIQLGEPHPDTVESHPKYLTESMSQGGNKA
ncbi:NADH dehydrogenase subunit 5 [Niallia sp. XMNu-256]|uniref:NADH dehydrogenase subunit 5 n=1 Tax=Niallia sp. XMNu-256 TaxID=3082444 RepID=UPI0030CBAB51